MGSLLPIVVGAVTVLVFGTAVLYLGGPLAIRFLLRQPAEPEFLPVAIDGLPGEVSGFLKRTAERLAPHGFASAATVAMQPQKNMTAIVTLFVNRPAGDAAAAIAVYAQMGAGAQVGDVVPKTHVEFCTEFSDGGEICTNNSSELSALKKLSEKQIFQFPDVRGADLLYRIHCEMVRRHAPEAQKSLPAPGQEVAHLRASWTKDLERQADVGYMQLDAAGGVYRPTLPGAFLMTWKLLPPVSWIRRLRMKREAGEILRLLSEKQSL